MYVIYMWMLKFSWVLDVHIDVMEKKTYSTVQSKWHKRNAESSFCWSSRPVNEGLKSTSWGDDYILDIW